MLWARSEFLALAIAVAAGGCATADIEPDGGAEPDAFAWDVDAAGPRPDAGPADDAAVSAPPPDAAPEPPDAAPCSPTWIELLSNGGFDAGAVDWTTAGGTIIYSEDLMPIGAQAGSQAAWLVGYNGADEQLYQTVTVPADATALRLEGYACYVTADTGGANDFLTIAIRDSGGTPLETLASYSNEDVGAVCGWEAFVLDAASAHAGETIQLHWHGTSNGSYVTSYFVDSLRLEAFACP